MKEDTYQLRDLVSVTPEREWLSACEYDRDMERRHIAQSQLLHVLQ